MEKNPLDVLNDWGKHGNDKETAPEATPAPNPSPAGSPTDDTTRQRAQDVAESFRKRRERQKRRASGQPTPTQNRQPEPEERSAEPNQPRAEAKPSGNSEALAEEEAREKRRRRTNWNLRQRAMPKPYSEDPNRREEWPHPEDLPMSFEIDRTKPRDREVPGAISDDELQKSGWGKDYFARRERAIDEEMAERAERVERAREKARERVYAEIRAIGSAAPDETKPQKSGEKDPAPEDGSRRKEATALSVREMQAVESALNAKDYDALMRAYGRMAKVAGEDPAAAEETMRQNFSEADVPKLKQKLLEELKGVTVEIPRDYAEHVAQKERAQKRAQERAFVSLVDEALRRSGNENLPEDGAAGATGDEAGAAELAPEDAAKVDGLLDEAMALERARQLQDAYDAAPRKRPKKKSPPENRDRDGNPIEVDVIADPDAVVSPSQKRALGEKARSRSAARKAAAVVDEEGNVVPDATPEFARERHEADMTADEAKGFKVHRAAEGNEDAESARRWRAKVEADLEKSRAGRRNMRKAVDDEGFRRNIRVKKGSKILTPDEVYAEGNRAIREQLEMERELAASLPPEGDDGARARAAIASAVAEAAASIASGGNPYERLYETLRKEAPLVVGLGNEYTAETITEIVEALRRGEPGVNLADLPETFGIRQAVAQIHEQELRAASVDRAEKASAIDVDAEVLSPLTAAAGAAAGSSRKSPVPPPAPGGAIQLSQAVSQPGADPRPSGLTRFAGAAPQRPATPGGVPPVPPTPPGPPPIPTPAAAPAPAPAPVEPSAAPAPSRSWRRVLGSGLLLGGRILGGPFSRLWNRAITEPSFPGKENPFKKERGPLYPFFWGFSQLWQTIGGIFGAKFEKKKEEKAK